MKVTCEDRGLERELWEFFTFKVPNAIHNPKVKNKIWDGNIRLYNFKEKTLYRGLLTHVKKFCEDRGYRCRIHFDESTDNISIKEVEDFVKTLKLPEKIEIRDYQLAIIAHCIREKRMVVVSAVNSGKSLSIYSVIRYLKRKTLLVVPSTSLVEQMYKDFKFYSQHDDTWNVELQCSKVMQGYDKTGLNDIVITTWQSAVKQPPEWFEGYDMVIVDEAHEAKAKSLRSIMDTLIHTEYRFGFTGSMDDIPVHELVLTGMFGPPKTFIRTREMIDRGFSADLHLKVILLQHNDEDKFRLAQKANSSYPKEVEFLLGNERRNEFIVNLALSLKGNVLIFYNFVDKHGKILYDKLLERGEDRQVSFIYGDVSVEDRETVRELTDQRRDNIIVASYGTYQRGINVVNLDYMIFAFAYKAKTRNVQSIGRGLRKGETKSEITLFDIADDLSWEGRKNHTLIHLGDRLKTYAQEKLKYKIYKVKLNKNG